MSTPSEWTCASCTLVNPMETLSCGACRKAQPRGSAKKAPKRKATKRAASVVATPSKVPAKREPVQLPAAVEAAGIEMGLDRPAVVRVQARAVGTALQAYKTADSTLLREPVVDAAAVAAAAAAAAGPAPVSASALRRAGKVKAARNTVREAQAIERFISRQLQPEMQ